MNLSLPETRLTASVLKQDPFMCLDHSMPEQVYVSFLN